MGCRLPGSGYKAVFKGARVFRGRFCVAHVSTGGTPGRGPAAGVIAAKRTFRRAVDRNRAKRLMREAFRLVAPGLENGFECILVARGAITRETGMGEVRADIEKTFRKAKRGDTAGGLK